MKTVKRRNYGRGHGYLDDNGNKLLGVTTAISKGVNKPALVNWAAKQAAGYAVDNWDTLNDLSVSERLDTIGKQWRGENKQAMARGTQIHALAEHLIKGEEVDVPEHVTGHVESYMRFLEEWDPDPVVVEGVVGNLDVTPAYGGTLDLIADMAGERWLLDLKTGKGVYGDVSWQLAAYRYATILMVEGKPEPMPAVDRVGVLHVTSDSYEVRPVEAGPSQFTEFRYITQIAAASERSRDYIGEAIQK